MIKAELNMKQVYNYLMDTLKSYESFDSQVTDERVRKAIVVASRMALHYAANGKAASDIDKMYILEGSSTFREVVIHVMRQVSVHVTFTGTIYANMETGEIRVHIEGKHEYMDKGTLYQKPINLNEFAVD